MMKRKAMNTRVHFFFLVELDNLPLIWIKSQMDTAAYLWTDSFISGSVHFNASTKTSNAPLDNNVARLPSFSELEQCILKMNKSGYLDAWAVEGQK